MGTGRYNRHRVKSGFSLVELLIVLSILGILASVAIPIFLQQKDDAIIGVTKANLNTIRSALTQYSIGTADNRYLPGTLGYFDFRAALPGANLPPSESEARMVSGSFLYSGDGASYTLNVISSNRTAARFSATPSGIFQEK